MNAVNRLKRDHELFRSTLNVLESALWMGSQAWYVLREGCFALGKQLDDHSRREEDLHAALYPVLSREQPGTSFASHAGERRQLALINRLLITSSSSRLERIGPSITRFISALRHRMDQQGSTVFPTAEDTLMLSEMNHRLQAESPPWNLSETMTVGEVVARYPAAGSVLERFFIDQHIERYDCLDEVAWRHGMESQELLAWLERELARELAPERQRIGAIPGAACDGDPGKRGRQVLVQA